jgi:LysM repeat protein
MKYVEKYRKFAKEHPVAQSLIYAALIAAAGISGVGAGGAAALGLLKMTDKLLQGEKFSSAAYSGAKTGALAYGASQLAQYFKNPDTVIPTETPVKMPDGTDYVVQKGDTLSQIAQKNGVSVDDIMKANSGQSNPDVLKPGQNLFVPTSAGPTPTYQGDVGTASDTWSKVKSGVYDPSQISTNQAAKYGLSGAKAVRESKLTESQIKRMFYVAGTLQDKLTEGVWDKVKGAASKAAGVVANKAQTVGTNLTTKVTADKLMTAWKRAGSPTDSDAVAAIMKQAGVDDAIIASSMKAVSGQQAKTGGAGAFDQMANQLAPADTEPAKPVDAQTQKFIQQLVASYTALTPEEKAQLKKELQDAVTASDVGGNVVKATNENKQLKKRTVR